MGYKEARRYFVVIGNTPIFQATGDTRNCHTWCLEDLNIAGPTWDALVRGYILDNDVVFFTGGDMYTPVITLTSELVDIVLNTVANFGKDSSALTVYNGVRPMIGQNVVWPRVFKYNKVSCGWELSGE